MRRMPLLQLLAVAPLRRVAAPRPATHSVPSHSQTICQQAPANGNSVALFSRGLKKYAALHGEPWHEIVAVGADSFVAKDRQLKVTLARDEYGEVNGGEVLMVVPADRISKAGSRKPQIQSVAMR